LWKLQLTINFATELHMRDKLMIRECLKLIRVGMANTLVTFGDKHYECDVDRDDQDKGLTIGGYESAWLEDLVTSHLGEHIFFLQECNLVVVR
jgi:hypothetical protein